MTSIIMDQNDKIIQKLMDELGLSNLSQGKKDELIAKMAEVILKRMFVETVDELGSENQEAYGDLLDKGASPEEIEKFLREKIPDYEQKMEKIAADFRNEMINDSKK
jgi:hypothetical protein